MQHQLDPFLQPITDPSGVLYGYEVLMRFKGQDTLATSVIPRWEESGFISFADLAMLRCIKDAMQHIYCKYRLCVNLSIRTVENAGNDCLSALTELQRHVKSITVELTETAIIKDSSALLKFIAKCQALQIAISLDDCRPDNAFGTDRFISLVRPQFVKIDGAFLHESFSSGDHTHIKDMISIAKHCNARVIAEYIDSVSIKRFAVNLRVDYLQGFMIGKPQSVRHLLQDQAANSSLKLVV